MNCCCLLFFGHNSSLFKNQDFSPKLLFVWKCISSKSMAKYEPGQEKMCLMSYANNKGADQPAHPRSLISAFVVRWLDSIISLDFIAEISRL